MKWSSRIDEAVEIAARMHGSQFRRNGLTPYIVHPITVAWMVSEYTDNENTIIAALFHDLIEDVEGYDLSDIEDGFGAEVANMVEVMSNNTGSTKGLRWIDKKTKHFIKISKANDEVLLILLMNHLHNLVRMQEELKEFGNDFWDKFHGSRSEKGEWEEMNWRLFKKRKLHNRPVQKMRELIDEIYGGAAKTS